MRKLTTEEFIERARAVHGNKYDYSKVDYKNAQTKVCVICPIHGEFWTKPHNFLDGGNCPKCVRNEWTTESFIEAARKIHGQKYDYSKVEYNGTRNKVCIVLHEKDRYGNEIGEFWQYPLTHLQGGGCAREQKGIHEDRWEVRTCPICGKEFKVRKKVEKITCSEECRLKYIELHKDEIEARRAESLKNAFAKKTKEERELRNKKVKDTCLRRYGKENFSQTEEGRKMLSDKMRAQKKEWDKSYTEDVLIPKYRDICTKDDLEMLEFCDRFNVKVRCKKCGTEFITHTLGYLTDSTTTNRCKVCHPMEQIFGQTDLERTFEEFLQEIKVRYYKNCRSVIAPQEIDFYLPDLKIGFELDGLYWHSDAQKPDTDYHLKKTEACKEKGVRLIHIFEDEWKYKQDICKDRILDMLSMDRRRVDAQCCTLEEIGKEKCKKFLKKYHLQGNAACEYAEGLYFNGELVEVMCFGRTGQQGFNEYEMVRLCTKEGDTVEGGAERLLKEFIDKYQAKKIVVYADRRWTEGECYEKIGFKSMDKTEPDYYFVEKDKRKDRFAFRKDRLLKEYGCKEHLTVEDFCKTYRINRIYDCGRIKYELNLED